MSNEGLPLFKHNHVMHDVACIQIISRVPGAAVPWFMMSSYLYYCRDISVISDDTFGMICRTLEQHWDTITHAHKHFILRSNNVASITTGFALSEDDYPLMTRYAAAGIATGSIVPGAIMGFQLPKKRTRPIISM